MHWILSDKFTNFVMIIIVFFMSVSNEESDKSIHYHLKKKWRTKMSTNVRFVYTNLNVWNSFNVTKRFVQRIVNMSIVDKTLCPFDKTKTSLVNGKSTNLKLNFSPILACKSCFMSKSINESWWNENKDLQLAGTVLDTTFMVIT